MIKKKRIEYIDIAKGIALFLVILGHLPIKDRTFDWIFSFHMPLFFILSGMTLNVSKYDNILLFIKRKAKQLVLPYIVFSFIGCIISFCITNYREAIKIKSIFFQFFYKTQPEVFHVGQLWFLICLFFSCILFYIVEKYIVKNKSKQFTILVYFIISLIAFNILTIMHTKEIVRLPISINKFPFKIDSALMALIFIKTGNVIYKNKIIDKLSNISNLGFIVTSIILLGTNIYVGMYRNGRVNICDCLYGAYINYFLAAISCSLLVLLISYKIKSNKILSYYGRNTLIMFAAHSFLIELNLYLVSIMNLKININYLIITIIICIELIPITYIYNSIMDYFHKYKIVKVSN